ncbi:Short chain dehydrogenase asqE [Colletotrichum viniferum]|nr:Short chain dehydrogenase asqE [Colletotrichum viniferum]
MSSSENASAIQPWSLSGKTALITGASRGMGKAIAIYLARKGLSNIAITYASNKTAAEDTLDQCRAHDFKLAGETTAEDFIKAMIANVYSPVATIVDFMKHATKAGGRVINISSVAGREANNDLIIMYGVCKATLDSYTRSFAGSFAIDTGITFNTVVVGLTAKDALVNARARFLLSLRKSLR